jgi:hypothetical protein
MPKLVYRENKIEMLDTILCVPNTKICSASGMGNG